MTTCLRLNDQVSYLAKDHLDAFANVKLVSSDGGVVRLNSIMLAINSQCIFDALYSMNETASDEDFVMATNLSQAECEMVASFVTEGVLPKPLDELLANPNDEANQVFRVFGITIDPSKRPKLMPPCPSPLFQPKREFPDVDVKLEPSDLGSELSQLLKDVGVIDQVGTPLDDLEDKPLIFSKGTKKRKKAVKNSSKNGFDLIEDFGDDVFYNEDSEEEEEEEDWKLLPKLRKKSTSSACGSGKATEAKYFRGTNSLKRAQEEYRDTIAMVIPNDFNQDDFDNFVLENIESFIEEPEDLPPAKSVEVANLLLENEKEFSCDKCYKQFTAKNNLEDHMTRFHEQHFKCSQCPRLYSLEKEDLFRLHMFKHDTMSNDKRKHECIHCGYSSFHLTKVKKHIKRKGPYHNNQCTICEATSSNHADFKSHMRFDHPGRVVFRCGICPEVFSDKKEHNKHRFTVHNVGHPVGIKTASDKMICDICGTEMLRTSYAKHVATKHSETKKEIDTKPANCPQCQKEFGNKEKMMNHVYNIHTTFPCDICGVILNRRSKHRHYKLYHMDNKDLKHKCELCGKGFIDNQRLKCHMFTHTNERPYVCQYCSRGFNSQGNLRMHIRGTHLGIKRTK